jgi:small subunit ribosomal protein S28
MRNCKLTNIGDPVGKTVVGRIYHVVGDDLYIDFGHKFGCVCTKPRDGRGLYIRGTEVRLKVKSLELSKRFLGYDRDLSLLEADCVLLGIHK